MESLIRPQLHGVPNGIEDFWGRSHHGTNRPKTSPISKTAVLGNVIYCRTVGNRDNLDFTQLKVSLLLTHRAVRTPRPAIFGALETGTIDAHMELKMFKVVVFDPETSERSSAGIVDLAFTYTNAPAHKRHQFPCSF